MGKTRRLVGVVAVLVFGVVAFTPVSNWLYQRVDWAEVPPGPASAIVALGSGVSPTGTLSARSLRRAIHGVRLYHRGLAPLLVLLGPPYGDGPSEAAVRADLVAELGIPPQAVLVDSGGRNTEEEAKRVKALLVPRGARRILLVTSRHHMPRARELFSRAGFEVVAAPVEEIQSHGNRPGERIGLVRTLLQELMARLYYRLTASP